MSRRNCTTITFSQQLHAHVMPAYTYSLTDETLLDSNLTGFSLHYDSITLGQTSNKYKVTQMSRVWLFFSVARGLVFAGFLGVGVALVVFFTFSTLKGRRKYQYLKRKWLLTRITNQTQFIFLILALLSLKSISHHKYINNSWK